MNGRTPPPPPNGEGVRFTPPSKKPPWLSVFFHHVVAHPALVLAPPLGAWLHRLTCYNHGEATLAGECLHCGEPVEGRLRVPGGITPPINPLTTERSNL